VAAQQRRYLRSPAVTALGAYAALAGVLLAGCTTAHPKVAGSTAATPLGTASAAVSSMVTSPSQAGSSPAISSPAAEPTPSPTPSLTPSRGPTASPTKPTPAAASADGFVATYAAVTATDLGLSWHAGCPVGPASLRVISLTYWGFDDAPHVGALVVSASVVPAVTRVFHTLFIERFPIRRMEPVANFGGSDDASMAVDNTSGFNCRYAVAPGTPRWSVHSYGEAIDVNTIENPYLEGGKVLPPAGAAFVQRTPYRAGMATAGGQLVRAFAAAGWQWGGRWTGSPDYQHFSATGG
jgi:hypothetical protein